MHLGLPWPPPPPLGRAIKEDLGRIRNRCRSTPTLCHPAYLCIWQPLLVSPEPRAGQQNPGTAACPSQQPESGTASQGAVPSPHGDLTLTKAGVRRRHLFLRSGSAHPSPWGLGQEEPCNVRIITKPAMVEPPLLCRASCPEPPVY